MGKCLWLLAFCCNELIAVLILGYDIEKGYSRTSIEFQYCPIHHAVTNSPIIDSSIQASFPLPCKVL